MPELSKRGRRRGRTYDGRKRGRKEGRRGRKYDVREGEEASGANAEARCCQPKHFFVHVA